MAKRYAGARSEKEGLWDWNLVTNRIHVSPRWLSLIGCAEHEIGNTPESWLKRIHPEDRERVTSELDKARHDDRFELDIPHRLRHKNGTYRWMSCRALVERDKKGRAVRLTGWHADVTAEEVTDSVTGLPNHKLLLDRLMLAIERARQQASFQFALLLIDLGRPSEIEAGLLTAVARRLETTLRTPDGDLGLPQGDVVARRQGDQFAVLLEGLQDAGHAKAIGDRLLGELLAPFTPGGDQVLVAASIGIAVSVTLYHRAEDVIRDAETALHRARLLGGSKCELFDTAVLRSEEAQAGLDSALKDALERNEFQLLYQPIMSLASNQIVGFEALVRWPHPTRGIVPPQDFIPLAEKTGFIVPLGRWIVREACAQLKRWHDMLDTDCWVSVNLSAEQLKHPALVDDIGDALADAGLEARHLTLELTESMAMENPIAIKALLMRLRALGVHISIDDFGTGHSSLAHLRQFPVDTLKVDRSFVRGIESQSDAPAIIGALTALARQLGLHVVVEGVENEAQLALLRTLQCDAVQGYLVARPLDVEGVETILTTGIDRPEAGAQSSGRTAYFVGVGHEAWRRMSRSTRWSTAAVVVILMTAGLARAWPEPPAVVALPALPAKPPVPRSELPRVSSDEPASVVAAVPARVVPAEPNPRTTSAEPRRAASAEAPHAAAVEPSRPMPVTPASAPLKESAVAASTQHHEPEPVVLRVIHLHKLGSCEGRLVIARDSLTFTPDKNAKDAFVLPHHQFVQSIDDDTLTVRSADKTYRFKAADAGRNDNNSELRNFAASMARLRQSPSSF